jgi:hypothetical protein
MFFQRALKSASVFYGAYAALRFNRKAPNPLVSRGRNDKHKLILKKITQGACLFAALPGRSLQRTPKILRPTFSGWFTLRFETMEHGGDLVVLRPSSSRLRLTLWYCRQRHIFCSETALIGMTEVQAERPPSCENCGCATVKIGKLSRIGSHPLINVYKCQRCRQIISITSPLFIRPEDVRSRA